MEALHQCFYFFLFRLCLQSYWFLTDYLRFYFQYFVIQHLNGQILWLFLTANFAYFSEINFVVASKTFFLGDLFSW